MFTDSWNVSWQHFHVLMPFLSYTILNLMIQNIRSKTLHVSIDLEGYFHQNVFSLWFVHEKNEPNKNEKDG